MGYGRVPLLSGVLAAAMAVAGCSPPPQPKAAAAESSETAKQFLGDRAIAILDGATRVETFRIVPERPEKPSDEETIGGYRIMAKGKAQGPEFARRLAAVLRDDKTYLFDMPKGCIFVPGVAFRVWRGDEALEVILCFQCDEFKFLVKDAQGKTIRQGGEDFDPARGALVRLAKDAFPDDQEIQALK